MNALPISTDDAPALLTELLFRLKVKDVMSTELVTTSRADTLRSVQHQMKEHRITGVPVAEQVASAGAKDRPALRLLGIVSVDDIISALDAGAMDDPVSTRMTRQVIVLEDDMPLSFAISSMDKYHFGRFPVLNKEKELVGIITSRDILVSLLVELNREAERIEEARSPAADESDGVKRYKREYAVRKYDFENAGKPTSEFKKHLKGIDVDPKTVRRIAVASYELEMNEVVHSNGGTIAMRVTPELVEITASDSGPGIENVELALQEGYSTATEWIRSLGFGAGMGLPNARRSSDEFEISSGPNGTTVRCRFTLAEGVRHEDT